MMTHPQGQADNLGIPLTIRELADAATHRSTGSKNIYPSLIHGPTIVNNMPPNATTIAASRGKSQTSTNPKRRNCLRKGTSEQSEMPTFDGLEDNTSAYTATLTRVLRPRAAKSAAQIQEEREREQAYRRAIAE